MDDIRKIEDETKKALDEVRMAFVILATIWLPEKCGEGGIN